MRLSPASAAQLPAHVRRPAYDRDGQQRGIVHFGIGAFHRAHQALYTDEAMSGGDRDWAITGVSLRSDVVRNQLGPQAGLYTVTESDAAGHRTRLVGAVREVLAAAEDPARVVEALAAAQTHVVSISITEKGYWRGADSQLDLGAADILHDLRAAGSAHHLEPAVPRTLYGFLAAGLAQRRARALPGLTLLSCDNLAANGRQLQGLLEQFLERRDPGLRRWFLAQCACPSTMVDRIVPATTPGNLQWLAGMIGMRDEAAVLTEPFSQWVIEDRCAGPRPRWELGGAQWVRDAQPYETAKLRMLNGAHSALAYAGLLRGHEFVHQAIADPVLLQRVDRLMRQEAAPSFVSAPGQSLQQYADWLLRRFGNPARPHRLAQIAMDGSQKIPQRWLATLRARQQAGAQCGALLQALAAWILYVRGDRFRVEDPLAAELAALWAGSGAGGIVDALFGTGGRFAAGWTALPQDRALLQEGLVELGA